MVRYDRQSGRSTVPIRPFTVLPILLEHEHGGWRNKIRSATELDRRGRGDEHESHEHDGPTRYPGTAPRAVPAAGAQVPKQSEAFLAEVLHDLQQTVEELRQQNEELALAREAAEADRQRYRELFEFAPDGYVVTDAEGVIEQANRVTAAMLQVSQEALVKKPLALFVVEDEHRAFRACSNQLKQGEGVQGWEVQLQPRQRAPFPAILHVAVARDLRGRPVGLRWLLSDIERKQAEEALANERTLLQTLIDRLPDYIFIKDADSRFVLNNRAHLGILGVATQAEVIGKTDFEFFSPVLAAHYYADEQEIVRSGQPLIDREETVLDREGRKRWLLTTKVPLRDGGGVVTGLVGISHDITARRQAEAALREQRDFAESLVETAQAVVLVLDLEGRILRFNRYLEELAGYRLEEVEGKDWFRHFLPPQEQVADPPPLPEHLGRRRHHAGHQLHPDPGRPAAGNRVVQQGPHDAQGYLLGVLAIGHDITDLREAQRRALQSERLAAIGQMIAGLTHESRNVLQASQVCLELLSRRLRGQPDIFDLVEPAPGTAATVPPV